MKHHCPPSLFSKPRLPGQLALCFMVKTSNLPESPVFSRHLHLLCSYWNELPWLLPGAIP